MISRHNENLRYYTRVRYLSYRREAWLRLQLPSLPSPPSSTSYYHYDGLPDYLYDCDHLPCFLHSDCWGIVSHPNRPLQCSRLTFFRTYVETSLATSTIVVTECPGGSCGGEVTVTEPDTTIGTTTQVELTYTTTCPVTVRLRY